MPLSPSGRKVMSSMRKQYGDKKGESVFYASINKGVKGSSGWEKGLSNAHAHMKSKKT